MNNTGNDSGIQVSVILPCYNEEENVRPMYDRLKAVLDGTGRTWEIIYIDDGSRDGTSAAVKAINQEDPRVRLVQFRRNFGQTAALAAGLEFASGDLIVAMDSDLQYQPEDIPMMLAKSDEGYDIVSGWRAGRNDNFLTRRLPSLVANRLMRLLSGVKLRDFGSTFKCYRREVAKELRLYGEMHRFIPAFAHALGARIIEVPVELRPRVRGKSKYGLGRTPRVFLDIIAVKFLTSYARQPLRLFGGVGLVLGGAGFGIMFVLTVLKVFFNDPYGNHSPLLIMALLLALLGMQSLSLGLLGELITRTYHESQGKPIYSVRTLVGDFGKPAERAENEAVR